VTNRPPTRRAFTLIEVMIVIAIIAMVVTAGIPMMTRALNKDQLAKAVNDVLEGCKLARDRAILQNRPYDFVIRSKNETEWDMNVEPGKSKDSRPAPGRGSTLTASANPASGTKEVGTLAGDFPRAFGREVAFELIYVNLADHMGAAEARVRFHENGTADELTLIMHAQGKRRTIKVDIITGAAYEVVDR
jgi:prepilin-type N-terminal cleavage/methylation domain-containing protein